MIACLRSDEVIGFNSRVVDARSGRVSWQFEKPGALVQEDQS